METENMIVVETTGTSSEVKKQYEKHEKFLGGFFLFSLPKKEKGRKYEKQKGGEIRIKCCMNKNKNKK